MPRSEAVIDKIVLSPKGDPVDVHVFFWGFPKGTYVTIQAMHESEEEWTDIGYLPVETPAQSQTIIELPQAYRSRDVALRFVSAANYSGREIFAVVPVIKTGWERVLWGIQPRNWFWFWRERYWLEQRYQGW